MGQVIILLLEMRKLRYREDEEPAQEHKILFKLVRGKIG